MRFDWITFGLQIVNVLVLLAILRHFLFRPVIAIVARRQAEIDVARAAADSARAAAATAEAAARAEAAKTEAARRDLLASAQEEADGQRRALIESGRSQAAAIVTESRSRAVQAVADAEAETLRRARDLAETIARRALSALPDPPVPAGFAERLAGALAALPDDQRRAMLAGDGLRLVAAHPLSPDDRRAVAGVLQPLGLPDPVTEADPALIAGLDLRSANGAIHNSLAHDLRRISEAMENDDGSRA